MSAPDQFVETFIQEASEHLQFLREYSGILQDPYPAPEDLQRLFVSSHTLEGSSGLYGLPLFLEVVSKLSHIFQYALNASIAPDAAPALAEFISEAVSVLESDLLMVSATGHENADEIHAFKQRYPFAFQPATVEEPEQAITVAAPAPDLLPEPEPLVVEEVALSSDFEAPLAANDTEETAETPELPAVLEDLPPDPEMAPEIAEFFTPEVEEHLQVAQACLLELEKQASPEQINLLFRALHTIKGSAAQVGAHRIATVAHRAEDLVGDLRDGVLSPTPEIIDVCLEAVDAVKRFLYSQWSSEEELQSSVKNLIRRVECASSGIAAPAAQPDPVAAEPKPEQHASTAEISPEAIAAPVASPAESQPHEPEPEFIAGLRGKESSTVPQSKSVRIALERLDSMMNAVGELVINRTRMLGRLGELERLADVLNFSKARMSEKIETFQEKYEFQKLLPGAGSAAMHRPANVIPFELPSLLGGEASGSEFSELEMDRYDDFGILSRSLTEISADITEVLTQLDSFVRKIDSDIDEFTKLAHRLQDEITQARMVPIGNLYSRISRTVRDAAKASGKLVKLDLAGAETELDNNIIQQISDPLIHMARNAVAHGIESPEERYQSGKADEGSVAVRAYHRGNHIFIEVEDDGAGLDFTKIRDRALQAGLISEANAAELGEKELTELLFHPGFTTADHKSELAGRGVGLDVVKANLAALNGEIDITSQPGLGTRFTLKVPLTLIISQALFVRCGSDMFALPLAIVEEIRLLPESEIEEIGGKLLTRVRDVVTEVIRLDEQLGLARVAPLNGAYRMVIVNIAGRQVGIVVEDVLRKDEIVIKSLGEYLRNVRLFPGATIAPDGTLILLIDVTRLVAGDRAASTVSAPASAMRVFSPGAAAVAAGSIPQGAVHDVVEKVVVLADDSISVRKFVGNMLEKAGYRVRLAADGLEALEIASQVRCDLIISDLEMPRTNGYELLAHLRQDEKTRRLPVMIVTSRAGAKHRDRAMKDGAAAFLTKPVQEDQLLDEVRKLIGAAGAARAVAAAVYA